MTGEFSLVNPLKVAFLFVFQTAILSELLSNKVLTENFGVPNRFSESKLASLTIMDTKV